MELMEHGDLRKYLRSLRPDNKDKVGPPPELKVFIYINIHNMNIICITKCVHLEELIDGIKHT